MKTDDLIAALAADDARPPPQTRLMVYAVAAAAMAAAAAFFVLLDPRPDFLSAFHTLRFDFKFVITFVLAAGAFVALRRAMRPEMGDKPLAAALLIAPALMLVAVILELVAVPSAQWLTRWFGHNWLYCMGVIPVLSLMPLAILLAALRTGASTAPARTGALAGLLAGGIGALFYAAHCPDDSPLFVATWYTIAIGLVTAAWRLCRAARPALVGRGAAPPTFSHRRPGVWFCFPGHGQPASLSATAIAIGRRPEP